MSAVREIPPIMVLEEDGEERQTYRFHGKRWALFTFVISIALVGATALARSKGRGWPIEAFLGAFAALTSYSTLYSLHANQWLEIDGRERAIRFHKENFYGLVDWRRDGSAFDAVRVFRANARAANWSILLVASDGLGLNVGENALGSLRRERALEIANKIGRLAGIPVIEGRAALGDFYKRT
jgi:hypothetical protein